MQLKELMLQDMFKYRLYSQQFLFKTFHLINNQLPIH